MTLHHQMLKTIPFICYKNNEEIEVALLLCVEANYDLDNLSNLFISEWVVFMIIVNSNDVMS